MKHPVDKFKGFFLSGKEVRSGKRENESYNFFASTRCLLIFFYSNINLLQMQYNNVTIVTPCTHNSNKRRNKIKRNEKTIQQYVK